MLKRPKSRKKRFLNLLSLIKPIEDLIILGITSAVKPLLPNNTQATSFSLILRILTFIALSSSKKTVALLERF